MPAVETSALRKVFGRNEALHGLDLSIPEGSVFGFLGPNGAGKTTTLRILLGLIGPTSGSASVLGLAPGKASDRVGYLPDVPGFYDWMTAPEFLGLCGALTLVPSAAMRKRLPGLLDTVGLTDVKTCIGGYSRGMKQRLGIAQALVNDPKVVFLDEPTSALDPIGRKEVLECIGAMAGRTVVFSTHILADVERVCDRVAILDKGRVVASDEVSALRSRYAEPYWLVEAADGPKLASGLSGVPWGRVISLEGDVLRLAVSDEAAAQRGLPEVCASLAVGLRRLQPAELTLEDVFMRLVGGDAA